MVFEHAGPGNREERVVGDRLCNALAPGGRHFEDCSRQYGRRLDSEGKRYTPQVGCLHRRILALVAAAVAVSLVIVGLIVVLNPNPSPSPPFRLSISTDGTPTVGNPFRILTDVKGSLPTTTFPEGTFVSIEVEGLQILSADTGDDPWGLPSVWNVTGLNLTAGVRFSLDVNATFAGEFPLLAFAWSPLSGQTVQIDQHGHIVNVESIRYLGGAGYRLVVPQPSTLEIPTATSGQDGFPDPKS